MHPSYNSQIHVYPSTVLFVSSACCTGSRNTAFRISIGVGPSTQTKGKGGKNHEDLGELLAL